MKPYVINRAGKTAKINMYGEVVETRPTDWLTGEPAQGDYITQDDFLQDLDGLKDMDEITIHLNSVGGSLYAGLAICNRLRELPGTVTIINDALAASAGAIILQGASDGCRLVKEASNTMVHQASSLLWGYYNEQELLDLARESAAHNAAIVNLFAARTGRSPEEVANDLAATTWMTGSEAISLGYADALAEGETEEISVAEDRMHVRVGNRIAAMWMPGDLPENISICSVQPEPAAENILKGGFDMEPVTNAAELREQYPELCAEIEAEAVQAERARMQAIDSIAATIDAEMLQEARYVNVLSAEQLALKAMQQQAALNRANLNSLETAAQRSGVSAVPAVAPAEDRQNEDPVADAKNAWASYQKLKEGK